VARGTEWTRDRLIDPGGFKDVSACDYPRDLLRSNVRISRTLAFFDNVIGP
jgi:hypothetical protein